jgi:hypothetical protein
MHVLASKRKRVPHIALIPSFVLAVSFGEEMLIMESLANRNRPLLEVR